MSTKAPTIRDFQERFPTEEVCLEHLMRVRYGSRLTCFSCFRDAKYYRVAKRRCYECEHCGHQVYPTAGTPFEKTRTSLRDWFFVMFLFTASRNGVSSKEVQRQIGVTYKTAWRMTREIRVYMGYVDGDYPLGGDSGDSGIVEADKAFIGGADPKGQDDKAIVLGMAERGGDVITRVVHSRSAHHVVPPIVQLVRKGSRLATDEAKAFGALSVLGFRHDTVNHAAEEWVRGDTHTNTIEGFWSNVKRGISGTYVWVSKKHLQKYLWEFEFRHNLRHAPYLMFDVLLQAFSRVEVAPAPPSSVTIDQTF